jgi:hypothetical protein
LSDRYFKKWKRVRMKAILCARVATRALNLRNEELQKTVLTYFTEAAHSRRIARHETLKFFRFKPQGPFTPVNIFYTEKRR